MGNEEKLKKIINHFGLNNQIDKFKEEVCELVDAIYKDNGYDRHNIVEEVADVYVVLTQIILHYGFDNNVIRMIANQKVDRTLERIKTGYYLQNKNK